METNFHQGIANFFVKMAENSEISEEDVINEISKKTEELFAELKSLAKVRADDKYMITVEDLRSKKFNSNLENFLFNYAVAENMMIL